MTALTTRLRKLETATGANDPYSLLTDEELDGAIAAIGRAIQQRFGMSPEDQAQMIKDAGPLPPLDHEQARDLVRRIKNGELTHARPA